MRSRPLSFGKDKGFSRTNKRMARMVAIGGVALSFTFSLFVSLIWDKSINPIILWSLPVLYAIVWGISYIEKLTPRNIYNILLGLFVASTYVLTYVGYKLDFAPTYDVLMIATINIMLLVMASRRQLRIYFFSVFPPGIIALIMAKVDTHIAFILPTMFLFGAILSYVITTQRNNLYKRVKHNENILKALLQSTNESIILVNYFSKKIVDVNEKALKEFGYSDFNELIGKNYTETLFADYTDLQNQRMNIKKQLNTRGFFETEIELTKKDSSKFWALLTIIPFEAENENFYLLQIRNIEEKKKIENELRENNFWFNFIMNNIDEFIYVVKYYDDGTKKFEYVSPYIQEIFGISSNDFLSEENRKRVAERYHPEDLEKTRQMLEVYRKEKIPVEGAYRFKPIGSDEYIWILEKTIPKLNDKGEIAYTLGVLRKIPRPADNEQ